MKEEKIRLIPPWLFTIIIMDMILILTLVFAIGYKGEGVIPWLPLSIILGTSALLIVLLLNIRLSVKMDYRDIIVKVIRISYKPLQFNSEDIKEWQIRSVKPLSEFHGYGKCRRKGVLAYVADTRYALEFEKQDGSKIVVSIEDVAGWKEALCRSSAWADKYRAAQN